MRTTRTISVVLGLAAMLALAGTAVAGKPSSSLNLVVLSDDDVAIAAATTPAPTWAGRITFDVSTTQSDRPFVNVRCYQGTSFVYDGWHGFFDGYYTDPVFTLASDYWTGGDATCTARLVSWDKGRERTLVTTTFVVSG